MLKRRIAYYDKQINIITPVRKRISPQRQAWEHDIPAFAVSCLPNNFPQETPLTEGHHKLLELCQVKNELILISAFRSYGKSTIATFLDPLHKIAHSHVRIILFVGFNVSVALQFSGAIKGFLEDPPDESYQFRQHYVEVCGSCKGPKEDFKTPNGVRLISLGVGQSPRSKLDLRKGERIDMAVADDYETDESARSQVQTGHIIHYLFQAVAPALRLPSMGGHWFRAVNTTLSPISAQTTLLKDEQRKLKRFYMPLVDEHQKSTWEAAIPTKDLPKIRQKNGLLAWHSEYLLKPIAGETQIFQEEWFQYLAHDFENREYAFTVGAIDVASTFKKTSDFKAVVIMGIRFAPQLQIVVRHVWQGRVPAKKFWKKIHELQDVYDCDFAIETNMLHEFLWESIDKYQLTWHCLLRLFPVVHTLNKEMRMSRLEHPYSVGEIWHIKKHSHQQALEDQLIAFPNAANDDLHDAEEEAYQQVIRGIPEVSDFEEHDEVDNPVDSLEREW